MSAAGRGESVTVQYSSTRPAAGAGAVPPGAHQRVAVAARHVAAILLDAAHLLRHLRSRRAREPGGVGSGSQAARARAAAAEAAEAVPPAPGSLAQRALRPLTP